MAVVLLSGVMRSDLKDEIGCDTLEDVHPVHMVGEFGLLDGGKRQTSMRAVTDVRLLVLTRDDLTALERESPELALVLAKVCIS
jgi:CRP-like cAMP-binding protein